MLENRTIRCLIPNLLTLGSTLAALAGVFIVSAHHDPRAVGLLLLAGLFDALDGPVARRLGAQSRFGNLYDSMSDLVAFGVAPAMMLVDLDLVHPLIACLYVVAIQLRLTRYSAMDDARTAEVGPWFIGISAPDASYIGLLLGMLPFLGMDLGYLLASLGAVYPWRLMPKRFLPARLAVAALVLGYFVLVWYPGL